MGCPHWLRRLKRWELESVAPTASSTAQTLAPNDIKITRWNLGYFCVTQFIGFPPGISNTTKLHPVVLKERDT